MSASLTPKITHEGWREAARKASSPSTSSPAAMGGNPDPDPDASAAPPSAEWPLDRAFVGAACRTCVTPSSLGETASTAPVALAASRTRRMASGEVNSFSASATRATRRIPRRERSSAHKRMTPTNSSRFLSLCQSNLLRWFSCLCCRHLLRIAKSAPAGAKSLQWLKGSFIIGRGAGECAPSVSSWPCSSSITSRATSSRSMGGASGNAEHRRSVIPSSLRKYSSLFRSRAGNGDMRGGGEEPVRVGFRAERDAHSVSDARSRDRGASGKDAGCSRRAPRSPPRGA